MKTKKWAIIFLLFTGIILFAAQSALGGCEVADLDWLISGQNAPGPKLEGPITIIYIPRDGISGPTDMYWFLRLRKGSSFYSFAGGPTVINYPLAITDQGENGVASILQEFFELHVVETLYPGCNSAGTCPDIVLKSADMGVDEETPGYSPPEWGIFYFIANIQVGVHD